MGISHDPTRPSLVASSEVVQIFSHLESSDATRIGLVVSYDACTNLQLFGIK